MRGFFRVMEMLCVLIDIVMVMTIHLKKPVELYNKRVNFTAYKLKIFKFQKGNYSVAYPYNLTLGSYQNYVYKKGFNLGKHDDKMLKGKYANWYIQYEIDYTFLKTIF